mgnify:CR=1 FL=1
MRVAQIQFEPKLGDCSYNLKRIINFLSQCKDVDLIVLPELANSGYLFDGRDHALEVANQLSCLNYLDSLAEFSSANDVFIVSGYLEKVDDKLYNSSVFISPDGSRGNYRKIHLFMDEKKIFEPGNLGLPLFNIGNYKLGMLICFDYLFPEIWRIMALKGADLIVHPSNLITQNAYIVVPAQALMNGYYVITSNRIGREGEIIFCGKSLVVDPRGNIVNTLGALDEGILYTDIDPKLSQNKMITSGNHIFHDRRPKEYMDLYDL